MSMDLRRFFLTALAVVAGFSIACDDGTDPVATATVQVTAFIDANNSGTNDAGDVGIEGATITLSMVGSDAADLTATTDASGTATFDNVEVGSYTASIELPAGVSGVTLQSGSSPTVVADEEGASVSAEFRYAYNPGSINGHVFVGTGDYAAGEPVVSGVSVTVSEGGSVLTSVETDETGAYSVTGLLPGTYSVAVEVPPYLTGSASQDIAVDAEATITADFGLEPNPTESIAAARAAAVDDTVAIVGVAITGTAGDAAVLSTSSFYMQDDSGISIYLASVDAAIELGDSVLVYGTRGTFNDEVQLASLAVVNLGAGTLPTPTTVTAAEINGDQYQGQLAVLEDVVVDSIAGPEVWVSEFGTGQDVAIYIDSDAGIGIDTTFTVGSAYDVTGVVARYQDLFELKPRMPEDVAEETGLASIGNAKLQAAGTEVTVTGIITSGTQDPGSLDSQSFYMQDPTAGIQVFMGASAPTDLAIGDSVQVTGLMDSYQDHLQIDATAGTVTELAAVAAPLPRPVTGLEVNTGVHQGQLGVVAPVTLDSVSGSSAFVTDEAGDTVQVFFDGDSGIAAGSLVIGESYSITGIVTSYWGPTYQILPRMPEDVVGALAVDTLGTIAEARAAGGGEIAAVNGVVTVDVGNFGNETYIQDSEAGIAIFPGDDGMVEGDSVRVIGTTGAFNGNIQISVDTIIALGTGTVPTAVTITGTELNNGSNPGEIVTLGSITVDSTVVVNSFDSHVVYGVAGDGQAVQLYVDNRTGIASADWTDGVDYQVTGILSFRDPDWRIQPRKPADMTTN